MKINLKKYIAIAVLCILAAQALPTDATPSAQEETITFCSDFQKEQIKI
ncbi:MAG: hypothetical protein UFG06_08845 [Lachnospiraceae bacterium]|nr:hypothetical protein [Lachnospiraceae bacterium]